MDVAAFVNAPGQLTSRLAPDGQVYVAFVPNPLPPPLGDQELGSVAGLLAEASRAFGELSGIGKLLPNPDLLIRPYMRWEAIMSSRIEDTHTSFAELAALEASGYESLRSQTREVLRYVGALEYGLRHVRDNGFTVDLVRQLHRQLLEGLPGSARKTPGEVRALQNHIGGDGELSRARFVPPPPGEAADLLEQLVGYASSATPRFPLLIDAALIHYQFEAIHPFLDGNGRVGRVLIPLLFSLREELDHPLLYLSPYFEQHRSAYYDHLFAVSTRGEWMAWIRYFLTGIREQSRLAIRVASQVIELGRTWKLSLEAAGAPMNALRLAEFVLQHLVVTPKMISLNLQVSSQTSYNLVRHLERAGILKELDLHSAGKIYIADDLRAIIEDAA